MRSLVLITFFSLWFHQAWSAQDTTSVLRMDDYVKLIMANHPVVKQADILPASAEAALRSARGAFDPKLSLSYDLKEFKEDQYFNILETSLTIPTWFPVDPKISFDRNKGTFLNPENSIPSSNDFMQISAGLRLPVGKGLFIDERRMAVKQAEAYQDIAAAKQIKMINKILMKTMYDYWSWYLAYRKLVTLEQSVGIAQELFDRVLIDFDLGEAAAIDTVQAKIQLQNRLADLEMVRFERENARLKVSTHLWSSEGMPLELNNYTIPDTLADFGILPSENVVRLLVEWATDYHPEVLELDGFVDQLTVERAWNKESLKPQIDLEYSFLNAPVDPQNEVENFNFNNYKLGVDFSFPILLRKERGKLQKTNLDIQSKQLERNFMLQEISNAMMIKYAEATMSFNLAEQYEDMADGYYMLVNAELVNLELGDSDLFRFNIQLDRYLGARIKYLESLVKFQKSKIDLLYTAGIPYVDVQSLTTIELNR